MANENVLTSIRDYTLSRGVLRFREDGEGGWLDPIHIKDTTVTIESETLDHFSVREGIKEKDKTATTQVDASGSGIIDIPSVEAMRMFFLADAAEDIAISEAGATLTDEPMTPVTEFNRWYELLDGGSHVRRFDTGAFLLEKDDGITALVEGTDYKLDKFNGLVALLDPGAVVLPHTPEVTATYLPYAGTTLNATTLPSLKRHLWFAGQPSEGYIQDWNGFSNINPSGDLNFQADEWQEFTVNYDFESHDDYAPGLMRVTNFGTV